MPLGFDTYSECRYDCLYCCGWTWKEKAIQRGVPAGCFRTRAVDPQSVDKIFRQAAAENGSDDPMLSYIHDRRPVQWGELTDPFDSNEQRFGVTLDTLEIFDRFDHPVSFGTKLTWWTLDRRYMHFFERHGHNWHVRYTLVTADAEKTRQLEPSLPLPGQRLASMRRLSDIGVPVTLRLQPYIPGVSDDWRELMYRAREAGAGSVTTELMRLRAEPSNEWRRRYKLMSRIAGNDICRLYTEASNYPGDLRLETDAATELVLDMRDYAHALGMQFYASDGFGDYAWEVICDVVGGNCCGYLCR